MPVISMYRKIEQTLKINRYHDIPIDVKGEISVEDTTIAANDPSDRAERVDKLARDLEGAIDEVLDEYERSYHNEHEK